MATNIPSSTLPKEDNKTVITGISEDAGKSLADLLSGATDSLVSQRINEGNDRVINEIKDSVSNSTETYNETLKSVLEKNDKNDGNASNELLSIFSNALVDIGLVDSLNAINTSLNNSNKQDDTPDTSMTLKTPEDRFIEMHQQLSKQESLTKAALDTESINQFISEQSNLGELQERVYKDYLENDDKESADEEKAIEPEQPVMQKIGEQDESTEEKTEVKNNDITPESIINSFKTEISEVVAPIKSSLDALVAADSNDHKEVQLVEERKDDSDTKEPTIVESISQLTEVVKEVKEVQVTKDLPETTSLTKNDIDELLEKTVNEINSRKDVDVVDASKSDKIDEVPTTPQVVEHEVKIIEPDVKDELTSEPQNVLQNPIELGETSLTSLMSPLNELLGTVKDITPIQDVPELKEDVVEPDNGEQRELNENRIIETTVSKVSEIVDESKPETDADTVSKIIDELNINLPEFKIPVEETDAVSKFIDDLDESKKEVERIYNDTKELEHKDVDAIQLNDIVEHDNNRRIEIEEEERTLQQPDNVQMYEQSVMSHEDMLFLAKAIGEAVVGSYVGSSEIKEYDAKAMDAFMAEMRK